MHGKYFLALALLGCGPSGPCADRQGSYVVDFSTRSGNCGDQNEAVVNIQPGGGQTSCTGSSQVSADNCTVDLDVTCPFNANQSVQEAGQVVWSSDGSHGSGTIQLTLRDAASNILCSGTYDVHYQRQ